jgi:hypothetical protein
MVRYITRSLVSATFPWHVLVKQPLLSSLLLFLKMFDVFGFKYNILQKWTCNTDGQSYALVTFGIINFVDASGKMTFIFTRLIHVPERLLC